MSSTLQLIYKKIYGVRFSYSNFDDRINLQKAVYLLENIGVSIGDYSFSWDSHGPYSLSLDCDASQLSDISEPSRPFSEFAEESFSYVKNIVEDKRNTYSITHWMECIASLHYLINIHRINKDEVIKELTQKKPYLSNLDTNTIALEIAIGLR